MGIENGKLQDSIGNPVIVRPGANPDPLGKVLEDLVVQFTAQKRVLWEERIRLHVRARPRWCPAGVWVRLVRAVLVQSVEGRRA